MQFTKLIAACFLGLLSLSVAAPSKQHTKADIDFYAKVLLPTQIQRLHDFRSIWSPELTPKQNKFRDKLSNKLHHMDFKDFDKLQEEGQRFFPSNTEIKAPRDAAPQRQRFFLGRSYEYFFRQITAMAPYYQ